METIKITLECFDKKEALKYTMGAHGGKLWMSL